MIDKVTRGKTRAGRLRLLDRYLIERQRDLLRPGATVVDVGLGARPDTSLELARALRAVEPRLRVVALDVDPARVAAAARVAAGEIELRVGGFGLASDLAPRLVRAMNVLRQYPREVVARAHAQLAARLVDGGLLVEGSSGPRGSVLVASLLRKRDRRLVREAVVLATDFSRGFGPRMFLARAPRDLRSKLGDGRRFYLCLERWRRAWGQRPAGADPRTAWQDSLDRLVADGAPVVAGEGYLEWRWA